MRDYVVFGDELKAKFDTKITRETCIPTKFNYNMVYYYIQYNIALTNTQILKYNTFFKALTYVCIRKELLYI